MRAVALPLALVVLVSVVSGCPSSLPPGAEACSEPDGHTECGGGGGRTCCGGVWSLYFSDGPCGGSDAGTFMEATCIEHPTSLGCPCATEGAIECGYYSWSRVCRDGTWQARIGYVCC